MTTAPAHGCYTQNDEEEIILRHLGGIGAGTLIDIGAYDGITFSNSRRLIEMGWSAILVEPAPDAFARLQSLYATDPRVRLVNCALAPQRGTIDFFLAASGPEHPGLYATSDPDEAGRVQRRLGATLCEVAVDALTWSDLLRGNARDAAFLSIDTEGTSIDRLVELDLRALPNLRLICVERDFLENNEPCPQAHARVRRFCADHFFTLAHQTAENLLFARIPE